jgi:4-hydroxy-L-threonine phosphate dehydrogenase PdxA
MIAGRICFFREGLSRYFGIEEPEIGVAALNPHAFEFSLGEDEEIRKGIIQARRRGVRVNGPYAGDTLFNRVFDGYIAIYHDQAMVFLKSKQDGLNFTLGLPVIRLSPLCGTASDIAGKGCADITGFMAAFKTAKRLYASAKKYEKRMEYE